MDDQSVTDEVWRDQLSPEQYRVLREKGTEAPYSGEYVHENRSGIYVCAACGEPLFSSEAKYDSGSGWPSFTEPAASSVAEHRDDSHGMARTEVTCKKCGGHLGHVFNDGPTERDGKECTGLRYCINSASLKLKEDCSPNDQSFNHNTPGGPATPPAPNPNPR